MKDKPNWTEIFIRHPELEPPATKKSVKKSNRKTNLARLKRIEKCDQLVSPASQVLSTVQRKYNNWRQVLAPFIHFRHSAANS